MIKSGRVESDRSTTRARLFESLESTYGQFDWSDYTNNQLGELVMERELGFLGRDSDGEFIEH